MGRLFQRGNKTAAGRKPREVSIEATFERSVAELDRKLTQLKNRRLSAKERERLIEDISVHRTTMWRLAPLRTRASRAQREQQERRAKAVKAINALPSDDRRLYLKLTRLFRRAQEAVLAGAWEPTEDLRGFLRDVS